MSHIVVVFCRIFHSPQVSLASGGIVSKVSLGFEAPRARGFRADWESSGDDVPFSQRLCVDDPLTGEQKELMHGKCRALNKTHSCFTIQPALCAVERARDTHPLIAS